MGNIDNKEVVTNTEELIRELDKAEIGDTIEFNEISKMEIGRWMRENGHKRDDHTIKITLGELRNIDKYILRINEENKQIKNDIVELIVEKMVLRRENEQLKKTIAEMKVTILTLKDKESDYIKHIRKEIEKRYEQRFEQLKKDITLLKDTLNDFDENSARYAYGKVLELLEQVKK